MRLALSCVLLLAPTALRAQEPARRDSVPFRAGQWAVEFQGGRDFTSAGALWFTSPRRAWVLDVSGGVDDSRSEDVASGTTARTRAASADVRLGRRHYRHSAAPVASYLQAGVSGGATHSRDTRPGNSSRFSSLRAGVFAELGASYLLTPHFGLGAGVGAQAGYEHQHRHETGTLSDGSGGTTTVEFRTDLHRVFVSSALLTLRVTLYF